MEIIILLVILFFIYSVYKNNSYKNPKKNIDYLQDQAYANKKTLESYLKKHIDEKSKKLDEYAKKLGIKEPDPSANDYFDKIQKYNKKLQKDSLSRMVYFSLSQANYLKSSIIPRFEKNFVKLNIRYKHDPKKLFEIADDYNQWFETWTHIYDPIKSELIYAPELDEDKNYESILEELSSKLDFDMAWDKITDNAE